MHRNDDVVNNGLRRLAVGTFAAFVAGRHQVANYRGGKGSHRNFVHPNVSKPVTLSGKTGDDAKRYQERVVNKAIEELRS